MPNEIRMRRSFTLRSNRLLDDQALREIGTRLLVRLDDRIGKGRDEDQRAFTPYSLSYARAKGRRSPVDLSHSGTMRGDTAVLSVAGGRIQLGFRSEVMAQRARYHDSLEPRRVMPLRRFLGIPHTWAVEALRQVKLRIGDAAAIVRGR